MTGNPYSPPAELSLTRTSNASLSNHGIRSWVFKLFGIAICCGLLNAATVQIISVVVLPGWVSPHVVSIFGGSIARCLLCCPIALSFRRHVNRGRGGTWKSAVFFAALMYAVAVAWELFVQGYNQSLTNLSMSSSARGWIFQLLNPVPEMLLAILFVAHCCGVPLGKRVITVIVFAYFLLQSGSYAIQMVFDGLVPWSVTAATFNMFVTTVLWALSVGSVLPLLIPRMDDDAMLAG